MDIRDSNLMKKVIINIIFISAIAYFSACSRKVICPAYHSYFILDVEETRKTFTLFGADSLPKKNWEVDKEKYGIAKDIPDPRKLKEIRIISMNSIYKKIEDPFEQFNRELAMADSSYIMDSSAEVAQYNYYSDFQNIDQMIYLHHFGKYLPKRGDKRDELKEDLKQEDDSLVSDVDQIEKEPQKKKRKIWRFGKNKKKSKQDQTEDAGEEDQ